MISYDVFKRIDEKMKEILKNVNHKYKKTNIVFYDENSYYYNELMKYGGIIGVISENWYIDFVQIRNLFDDK